MDLGGMETRFIPTHVGNTGLLSAPPSESAVHPHACGEHFILALPLRSCYGSSPRMWGTPERIEPPGEIGRFIPTHVGNTLPSFSFTSRNTVHPHACGEHFTIRKFKDQQAGSSPRMWGTLPHRGHRDLGQRFIPTHVGNTAHPPPGASQTAVHPHACGEHDDLWRGMHSRGGSSPRMWGTLIGSACVMGALRFIPTHVGNTGGYICWNSHSPVHPHACGEHSSVEICTRLDIGSSPRMWGTRERQGWRDKARRFIPTHVGNTVRGG